MLTCAERKLWPATTSISCSWLIFLWRSTTKTIVSLSLMISWAKVDRKHREHPCVCYLCRTAKEYTWRLCWKTGVKFKSILMKQMSRGVVPLKFWMLLQPKMTARSLVCKRWAPVFPRLLRAPRIHRSKSSLSSTDCSSIWSTCQRTCKCCWTAMRWMWLLKSNPSRSTLCNLALTIMVSKCWACSRASLTLDAACPK